MEPESQPRTHPLQPTSIEATNRDLINFTETISKINSKLAEEAQRGLATSLIGTGWQTSALLLRQIDKSKPETSGDPFKNIDLDWGIQLPKSQSVALTLEQKSNQPLPFASVRIIEHNHNIPEESNLVLLLQGAPPTGNLACQRSRIARYVPTDSKGELLTFEEIAAKAKGRQALGFIKADILPYRHA